MEYLGFYDGFATQIWPARIYSTKKDGAKMGMLDRPGGCRECTGV